MHRLRSFCGTAEPILRVNHTVYGDDGNILFAFNTAQNNPTGNHANANTHMTPTLNQNVGF